MLNICNTKEPICMIYRNHISGVQEEVLVYDFIHNSEDETRCLCWSLQNSYWFKPSICELTPKIETRTRLNE